MLKHEEPSVPMKGNYSTKKHSRQLCGSNFVTVVWERSTHMCNDQMSTNFCPFVVVIYGWILVGEHVHHPLKFHFYVTPFICISPCREDSVMDYWCAKRVFFSPP